MPRLIDADELYRKVTGYQGGAVDKTVAKRLIEQMPTIEPTAKCIAKVQFDEDKMREIVDEAIVRCKDCKHRHEAECPMYHEEDIEWDDDGYVERDTIYHDWTEDDGFCDRGVRRTDDEEVH